jgi:hypothetical protein
VLPEQTGDAQAIYPWQVMVDFNQGKVIGLTAYYDKPVTFEDLRAAIDPATLNGLPLSATTN